MTINRAIVHGYVDPEIASAIAWAEAKGLSYEWHRDDLSFSLRLNGRSENETAEPYLLVGTFHDYRIEPPTWRFLDPRDGAEVGTAAYPLGTWLNGSVLHSNGLVCAPWSRDAYADRGGPHGDWGSAHNWEIAGPGQTHAITIPDMLARLYAEVQLSSRRMACLPQHTQKAP